MSRSTEPPRAPDCPLQASTAPALLLLAVDDEPMILDLMRLTLEPLGVEVVGCATAEDALRHLEEAPVDAVLTDLSLPGLDGFGLHQEMRRRGHPAAERTVLLTGDAINEGVDTRAADAGIGVLRKPFDLEALTQMVEQLKAALPPLARDRRPR